MSLYKIESIEEKRGLLKRFSENPKFLRLYNSILIDVNRWLPSVKYSFYSKNSENRDFEATYYFGNAQAGPL